MKIVQKSEDGKMTISISGEIDHHTASGIREQIDNIIAFAELKELVLNLGGVTFMDSSAIGIVLFYFKAMKAQGIPFKVEGVTGRAIRMYEMAGVTKLIEFI